MPKAKHKLLLLNPPSNPPVFRDCYCSGPSKGTLFVHPLDLQIQSGFFRNHPYEIDFIDAVFENLGASDTLQRIKRFSPDSVLALIGDRILDQDAVFFNQLLSMLPDLRLFVSGDAARFNPRDVFHRIPRISGLLMDFGSPGLLEYLEGKEHPDLWTRPQGNGYKGSLEPFWYPLPSARMVRRYRYRLPFFRTPAYYSIAGSFGCPYTCAYCNTHLLGYRERDPEDFIRELAFASKLGFKSLYIRDATFFRHRNRAMKLLERWEKTGLRFQWVCFTRPDLIDHELAKRAARLGCCLMMVGVESYDPTCLKNMFRPISRETVLNAFRTLQTVGIQSAAQILVGLHRPAKDRHRKLDFGPSSDYKRSLIRFFQVLNPDYISLNVFYPRPGVDTSLPELSALASNRNFYAQLADDISKNFYFHPGRMIRKIRAISSLQQGLFQGQMAMRLFVDKIKPNARG